MPEGALVPHRFNHAGLCRGGGGGCTCRERTDPGHPGWVWAWDQSPCPVKTSLIINPRSQGLVCLHGNLRSE